MKFHDHRWITGSVMVRIINHQCPMTLSFDLLTPTSIGHIKNQALLLTNLHISNKPRSDSKISLEIISTINN